MDYLTHLFNFVSGRSKYGFQSEDVNALIKVMKNYFRSRSPVNILVIGDTGKSTFTARIYHILQGDGCLSTPLTFSGTYEAHGAQNNPEHVLKTVLEAIAVGINQTHPPFMV